MAKQRFVLLLLQSTRHTDTGNTSADNKHFKIDWHT